MTTKELVWFCAEFNRNNLNPELLHAAKRAVLDFLGVSLGGAGLPSSQVVKKVIRKLGGPPESTVISETAKASSAYASLANGTMVHGLELDDVHEESSLHPGAVVIPAALAVAEREGADSESLALAIVLGYEVTCRVGMAVNPRAHYSRGFHPTSTCGTFGAAVAAGKLLQLEFDELLSAVGIAGSQAAGSLAFLSDGAWTKRLQPGWGAHSGVMAALLAQEGFVGPKTILEGRHGFLESYTDARDDKKLKDGLGRSFAIAATSMKPYACCRYMHPAIEATIGLVKEHELSPDQIEAIEVGMVKSAVMLVGGEAEAKYAPQSIVDAQFSMPFAAAVSAVRGHAFLDEFSEASLRNEEILSLSKKVKVYHDTELEKAYPKFWPAKVRIRTRSGSLIESRVDIPKGDPRNPLTDEELAERFSLLARKTLDHNRVEAIQKAVWRLEGMENVNELTALLR